MTDTVMDHSDAAQPMASARAAPPTLAMELALGTVQFGLAYGAVGSGQRVDDGSARQILAAAWSAGLRCLDTAATYGDIESRLAGLCGAHPFRIVSKVIPLHPLPLADRPAALRHSMLRSAQRLGPRLHALLFHSAADLLSDQGPALWAQARQTATEIDRHSGAPALQLGVSCYSPDELLALCAQMDITLAQLPANALDQRLHRLLVDNPATRAALQGIELHLRSAFLQGLLLAPERGAQRVPAAATALAAWQAHCQQQGLAPAVAALAAVKAVRPAQACVVGVESLAQLEEVAAAWHQAGAQHWPHLASTDLAAIDPRRWPPG